VAYSGGKDSQALLRLVRSVNPHALVVHNGYEGESVEDEFGILKVKPPKAETVPKFMEAVDLGAQFDATRRAENKLVCIDGKEIHRSNMTGPYTAKGYFGLEVYFPLWDWSDEEVLTFLEVSE